MSLSSFFKNLAKRILNAFFSVSSIIIPVSILIILTTVGFSGCTKNSAKNGTKKKTSGTSDILENVKEIASAKENNYFRFFYYSKDGFSFCEKPENAPDISAKPWTETFRTSDSGAGENGEGYLLVNKLGMMVFSGKSASSREYSSDKDFSSGAKSSSGGEFSSGAKSSSGRNFSSDAKSTSGRADPQFFLMRDMNIFDAGTAGSLIFSEGHPFFTLHRNSFFYKANKSESVSLEKNAGRYYIIRASVESNAFFPVITYADLGIESGEVTGTFFDGNNWISSIKTTSKDSTSFQYLSWKPASSLLSMQPYYREGKISVSEIDTTVYRNALEIKNFSTAPQRLKNLLGKVPEKIDFAVELKNTGGTSPRNFISGDNIVIEAKAIISPQWICCIFEDGTVYFNGALEGRELANKGLNFAFRLPKLSEGFVYTYFTIAGNNLVAGWEEKDFFSVGKSGFLVADFEKILYE